MAEQRTFNPASQSAVLTCEDARQLGALYQQIRRSNTSNACLAACSSKRWKSSLEAKRTARNPREGEEQLSQYVTEIAKDLPFIPGTLGFSTMIMGSSLISPSASSQWKYTRGCGGASRLRQGTCRRARRPGRPIWPVVRGEAPQTGRLRVASPRPGRRG